MLPSAPTPAIATEPVITPLFTKAEDGWLGKPDLLAAQNASPEQRAMALAAVTEEIDRIVLGFDVYPARYDKLLMLLEAPLPDALEPWMLDELASMRVGLSSSMIARRYTPKAICS